MHIRMLDGKNEDEKKKMVDVASEVGHGMEF
jgi:hypothetical protein